MVSTLASARAAFWGTFSSQRALAASLALGALLATSAVPGEAFAQRGDDKEQPAEEQNSEGFAAAYRPMAELVTGETKDWQAAAARVPTLVAAIENNRDRSVAGGFLLQTGGNVGDDAMRRQGLQLMYDSGYMSASDRPIIAFNLGIFAFQAGEQAEALKFFEAAYADGYSDDDDTPFNDVEYLILQSYVDADRLEDAYNFGIPLIKQADAAGSAMPDPFIRQTLQAALDLDDAARSSEVVGYLVKAFPSGETWSLASRIVLQFSEFSEPESLDIYRLMLDLGALQTRGEYSNYVLAANENLHPVEILAAIDDGIARGLYPASDDFVTGVRSQVTPAARRQRASMDDAYEDAFAGGGNNADVLALNVADQLLAVDDYERAITLYRLAKDRGIGDGMALTRIGMTQILAGNVSEGVATLATVSGKNKAIADLWTLYAEVELGGMDSAVEAAEEAMEDAAM